MLVRLPLTCCVHVKSIAKLTKYIAHQAYIAARAVVIVVAWWRCVRGDLVVVVVLWVG